MNLIASTPPATSFAPLSSSTFGQAGLTLVSHDPIKSVSGFPSPTTFSNATPSEFGQQTNKSLVYHYSTKSTNPDVLGPGALIFMYRNPRCFGLTCPDRSQYVADLIELNQRFEMMAQTDKHKQLFPSAESVLNEISFLGVLKGAITGSSRERHLGTCVLNNVVGERASTVNVWTNGAREGVPLYIILTKAKAAKTNSLVWKFVPYAGHGPPLSALMYTEDEKTHVGGAIFIGTAMSSPTACAEGNENLLDDHKRSMRLASYAGGVDVCVGV